MRKKLRISILFLFAFLVFTTKVFSQGSRFQMKYQGTPPASEIKSRGRGDNAFRLGQDNLSGARSNSYPVSARRTNHYSTFSKKSTRENRGITSLGRSGLSIISPLVSRSTLKFSPAQSPISIYNSNIRENSQRLKKQSPLNGSFGSIEAERSFLKRNRSRIGNMSENEVKQWLEGKGMLEKK